MICMTCVMFPGLDLYCADPAQPLTTAGQELLVHDLDHHVCRLSVRGVIKSQKGWSAPRELQRTDYKSWKSLNGNKGA